MQGLWISHANAIGDFGPAAVLPQGRYQAAFRAGDVNDIQNKYNDNGTLDGLSRMNMRFDNNFLKKNADFKRLAALINSQNPSLHAGDQLDLGSLQMDGVAQVNYYAPQLARGITSRWTLAIALPVVNFRANAQLSNGGYNNAPDILKNLGDAKSLQSGVGSGGGNAVNIESFKSGPASVTAATIAAAGYEPIGDRNDTFLGDVYLASVYQLYQSPRYSLFAINLLELPTGPKPNPDDLMTIPIFGRTALTNTLYNNFYVNYWLTLGLGLNYTYRLADNVTLRVPRYEGDFIPPASTKESLYRDLGDTVGFEISSMFSLSDYFQLGLGYEWQDKGGDRYSGDQGARYDLLMMETQQEAHIAKLKLSYSTITSFLGGRSRIPYSISYCLSDIFSGVNIEHQVNNELLMAIYF